MATINKVIKNGNEFSILPEGGTEGQVLTKTQSGADWEDTQKTEYTAGDGIAIYGDDYRAMRGPCPVGFHIPLTTEWQGVATIMTGLSLTTGDNWRINLHMPFTGIRNYSTAGITNQGYSSIYWSSSPYGSDYPNHASSLNLNPSNVIANNFYVRAYGFPVRAFKDLYVEPTASWTVIQGTLGGAGIFWNQSEGLISITDGTTGYTIQDKNLGATTVYNDGDVLTQDNMGNMYQRGNNYGFPSTGSVTTSSTQVDTSAYGPGNYYSSSTFINGSNDWSSVQNDNLRGGETGVVQKNNEIVNTAGVTKEYGLILDSLVRLVKHTPLYVYNRVSDGTEGAASVLFESIPNIDKVSILRILTAPTQNQRNRYQEKIIFVESKNGVLHSDIVGYYNWAWKGNDSKKYGMPFLFDGNNGLWFTPNFGDSDATPYNLRVEFY